MSRLLFKWKTFATSRTIIKCRFLDKRSSQASTLPFSMVTASFVQFRDSSLSLDLQDLHWSIRNCSVLAGIRKVVRCCLILFPCESNHKIVPLLNLGAVTLEAASLIAYNDLENYTQCVIQMWNAASVPSTSSTLTATRFPPLMSAWRLGPAR